MGLEIRDQHVHLEERADAGAQQLTIGFRGRLDGPGQLGPWSSRGAPEIERLAEQLGLEADSALGQEIAKLRAELMKS